MRIGTNDNDAVFLSRVDYQLLRVPYVVGYKAIESFSPRPLGGTYDVADSISEWALRMKHVPSFTDSGADGAGTWYLHKKTAEL